jgi:hypothetical protein
MAEGKKAVPFNQAKQRSDNTSSPVWIGRGKTKRPYPSTTGDEKQRYETKWNGRGEKGRTEPLWTGSIIVCVLTRA